MRDAWQREFIGADGAIRPDDQPTLVRALAFGLVPDELREADRRHGWPNWSARRARTCAPGSCRRRTCCPCSPTTGTPTLAYELLLRDTPPSWLTMIDRGATTVWESWEGIDADGRPHESLNHYSKGAVIDFLHRYAAGIRLADAPAYRSFVIEPVPGGGLTAASAAHESPYGRIESSWEIPDGRMSLRVRVPPGTTATVRVGRHGNGRRAGPARVHGSRELAFVPPPARVALFALLGAAPVDGR